MNILKNMTKSAAAATALIAIVACSSDVFDINSDPAEGNSYTQTLTSPISTTLEADSSFTEYVKVLRYSGLFSALNQCTSGVSFTAFAPTNDAMNEFYSRRGIDSLGNLSKEYTRSFVLYHTVKDSILKDAFITKTSIENLTGDKIYINIDANNPGQATLNGEGQVIEMARDAYNGKIYVLSRAMTPLVETVYDRIADAGTSTIFVDAITASGWSTRLSTVTDTVSTINNSGVVGKKITHYYYTVLNVSDATFKEAGISDLSSLKATLAASDDRGLSEDSLLKEYVGYHILENSYTTDDLSVMNGSSLTRIWGTAAANQVFTVSVDTLVQGLDSVTFNASGQSAKFVASNSNVQAKNGYVHELSSWLPVWDPDQSEVLWDLADYTDIKNLVPADEYQPKEKPSKESRTRVASAASVSRYTMGDAGTSNTSYSDIDYVTSTVDGVNNHDRLVFNLGYMGTDTLTTPTIIKGKYRVELTIVYSTSQSFMRTQSSGNGGLTKFNFDGRDDLTVYASPYTEIKSDKSVVPAGAYTSTLFSEVDFNETSTHTFSFVVLDPAASTNKGFSLQFDCIRFIPIE